MRTQAMSVADASVARNRMTQNGLEVQQGAIVEGTAELEVMAQTSPRTANLAALGTCLWPRRSDRGGATDTGAHRQAARQRDRHRISQCRGPCRTRQSSGSPNAARTRPAAARAGGHFPSAGRSEIRVPVPSRAGATGHATARMTTFWRVAMTFRIRRRC